MEEDINKIDNRLLEEDDRITSYLKGQMSDEEEQAFLKELEENPELKGRAIAMARMVKGLKQVGSAQDKETMELEYELICDFIKLRQLTRLPIVL